jgi:hypothetical protein
MNVVKFWNEVLSALGSTRRANNVNEFRGAYVEALSDAIPASKPEVVALTNLGGTITGATANDTMTAVADIALSTGDTYTDAAVNAAVNTAISSIENNLADLQAKVNSIIAALKA